MSEKNKLISIVTPSFNQGNYIEQTIDSVLSQNYANFEYIIIDGGSNDNTVEIIKKYRNYLTYWVSEKDEGQANAINKGLKLCRGDIFNWINSDDYLETGALKAVAKGFDEGADIVAGKVRIFRDSEILEDVKHSKLSAKGLLLWEPGVQFVQPGVWLKRQLIEKCGGIDDSFHYAFDWDLYIRYLSKFSNIKVLDDLLVHFRYHENSKTVSTFQNFKQEEQEIIKKLSLIKELSPINKFAGFKLKLNEWMPYYKSIVNDDTKSRLLKASEILRSIDMENLVLWRVAAGALKMALQKKKYSDE
ncbi:glycosyltransferase [Pontibacter sp. KCTC 32443]|uniref:glycosyltransferase family 2 protein n=1 Tax=Pontibacter TaxID=323449 RepID=UPI00164D6816|nr:MULTISPECIES: glycosyltransferase family 2 protein [Pontibacter]MBC5773495.1 glycosyltransferase [Pontibacter sp. KCTC 32443]